MCHSYYSAKCFHCLIPPRKNLQKYLHLKKNLHRVPCRQESIRTAFLLSQGGEFAFVLLSLANELKVRLCQREPKSGVGWNALA